MQQARSLSLKLWKPMRQPALCQSLARSRKDSWDNRLLPRVFKGKGSQSRRLLIRTSSKGAWSHCNALQREWATGTLRLASSSGLSKPSPQQPSNRVSDRAKRLWQYVGLAKGLAGPAWPSGPALVRPELPGQQHPAASFRYPAGD